MTTAPVAVLATGMVCASPAMSQGFPALIELSSLAGRNGFVLHGIADGDRAGMVGGTGDVNADGIDDFIIGAALADPGGEAYVVYGRDSPFPPALALSSLDGNNGFAMEAAHSDDTLGNSVSDAGDVNGDGIADLVVGAWTADPNGVFRAGEAYVVFGSGAGFPQTLELSALDGNDGFVVQGVDEDGNLGASVSDAGDLNGDGLDDLIIGTSIHGDVPVPVSYVVFGRATGFPAELEVPALDGSNGFVITGTVQLSASGGALSSAGDVNADGVDDVIIGAGPTCYVVFGTDAGFPGDLPLSSLDGSNGFAITGRECYSVGGGGDVNGDGVADVVSGSFRSDPNGIPDAGQTSVVFGTSAGFPAVLDLATLDGSNGFVINGVDPSDWSGQYVSAAGDVNADGIGDLIIGAPAASPDGNAEAGKTYVLFGSNAGFPATVELSALDGSDGFVIEGIEANDISGHNVSGAGDVNADGVDDVVIGAILADADGHPFAGESYVLFGCSTDIDADCDGLKNVADNCLEVRNGDQRDTDADGIGNACDGDFDQDCVQNFTDLGVMKSSFFRAGDLDTDMNGDGVTNFVDLGSLKRGFFRAPGPSGISNLCDDDQPG